MGRIGINSWPALFGGVEDSSQEAQCLSCVGVYLFSVTDSCPSLVCIFKILWGWASFLEATFPGKKACLLSLLLLRSEWWRAEVQPQETVLAVVFGKWEDMQSSFFLMECHGDSRRGHRRGTTFFSQMPLAWAWKAHEWFKAITPRKMPQCLPLSL